MTPQLLDAGVAAEVPLIPGVATASEVMAALQAGLSTFKFFQRLPGGPAAIKALSAPFADAQFCPTGGISQSNMLDYLALDSVLCGGFLAGIAPANALWQLGGITDLARASVEQAAALNVEDDS